jgi:hypothetical protein
MTTTIKVRILKDCEQCKGEAYFPVGQQQSYSGEFFTLYKPCKWCGGSGHQAAWIYLDEFLDIVDRANMHRSMELNYQGQADDEPISQYMDSREAAGI